MISKTSVYISLLISAAASVHAANDWSKPCFQGDCSYDVAASNTSVPASLRIVSTVLVTIHTTIRGLTKMTVGIY
jgi:hypothetical protein